MKKTIITILVLLLVISLSACGKRAGDRVENDEPDSTLNSAQNNPHNDAQNNTQHQPKPTVDVSQSKGELIAKDKAIEIALNKAGLTKGEVYDLESDLDREIQRVIWEVDFETLEYDYSYEIDANTGEIVLEEVEPEKNTNKPVQQTKEPQSEETVTQPSITPDKGKEDKEEDKTEQKEEQKAEQTAQPERITRDKAIDIALKKAGVTKDKVYDLEAELDKERKGEVWEVDFDTKEYEYSYEINAKTGDVIDQEKERND